MSRSAFLVVVVFAGACASAPKPVGPAPARAPQRVDTLPSVVAPPSVRAAPAAAPAASAVPAPGEKSAPAPRAIGASPDGIVDPFARIDRMEWPGPNRYRSASGQPGPDYWQQRADYEIAVTLDTAAQTVGGHVVITYTNNSPDTLTFVWLQLDQNLYREGSLGSVLHAEEARFAARGFRGGYEIRNLTVNGRVASSQVSDTRMRVKLAQPLAPRGARATIAMDFQFVVPLHGSDRMGRDGQLFEIAQWFPRMAVYDDVRGWNTDPYYGQGEFYLEYGDIDYAVTAPAGYTIAGSGVLQNPHEVLSVAQRARLGGGGARGTDRAGDRRGGGCCGAAHRRQDLALPRAERAGCGVGRRAGLPLGRDELERHPDARVLRVCEGWRGVGAGRRVDPMEHQVLFAVGAPVSVPAGHEHRGAGGGDGVPDVRDGALREVIE